ncbi:MAG: Holliday junction resolvase RuvX [Candidatus Falkowbacteria bacterium]|nr:Holliday junction resolvase RuvX [Candidatus Falkowbacteria bacterium]
MNKILNYLGLDWGEKRIGLATADSEVRLALPLKTVANLAEVLSVLKEEETNVIVIGAPQKMSGEAADNPAWVSFVAQLRGKSGLLVETVDERLSSLAADALGGEDKETAGRDEIAASIILQSYLDKLNG